MERYDITLAPAEGGHPLADAGVRHYLRGLLTRGLIVADGEHHGEAEVRIFMGPGPWAHTAFVEGTAPAEPIFLEAEFRFGALAPPPGAEEPAHFWLCLRGALVPDVGARFRTRFGAELRCRTRSWSLPHGALPPRPAAGPAGSTAGGAAEEPEATSAAPVGTWVEEL